MLTSSTHKNATTEKGKTRVMLSPVHFSAQSDKQRQAEQNHLQKMMQVYNVNPRASDYYTVAYKADQQRRSANRWKKLTLGLAAPILIAPFTPQPVGKLVGSMFAVAAMATGAKALTASGGAKLNGQLADQLKHRSNR